MSKMGSKSGALKQQTAVPLEFNRWLFWFWSYRPRRSLSIVSDVVEKLFVVVNIVENELELISVGTSCFLVQELLYFFKSSVARRSQSRESRREWRRSRARVCRY